MNDGLLPELRLHRWRARASRARRLTAKVVVWLMHPTCVVTALLAAGATLTVLAIELMFGRGPALLAGGVLTFAAAACVARGAVHE